MKKFVHPDPEYAQWLREHPAGFVFIMCSPPVGSSRHLHRADCKAAANVAISTAPTVKLISICSDSLAEVRRSAARTLGEAPKLCFACANAIEAEANLAAIEAKERATRG